MSLTRESAPLAPPTRAARFRALLPVFTPFWRRVAAVLAPFLAFLGLQWMQRTAAFPFGALPTGIWSTVFFNAQWVIAGSFCVLIGGALAYFFVDPYPCALYGPVVPSATISLPPRLRRTTSSIAGALPGLLGLGLWIYVLTQAPGGQSGIGVLVALVLAPVFLGLAIWRLWPGRPTVGRWWQWGLHPVEILFILAAMLAYVALNIQDARSWFFSFVGDEWAFYAAAAAIARGASVDTLSQAGVYGIHPEANSVYQALVMCLFGITVVGWKMACTLSVALPIGALYWLAKHIWGIPVAVAAVVFYATCHLLWAFSHIGYNNNDPLLVMIPAAALCYAGLRADRHALLFASGACAGAAWYTLFSGRLMIGILVVTVLTVWQGGWRAVVRRLLMLLAGFVVVALPLILDNGFDTIGQMFPLISLSQARTTSPVPGLLQQNTVRGLYAFFYALENTHYVLGEVFDVVSGTALCLGLAMALRQVGDLGARLALIWFLTTLMLTTPLYYVPQIADTRLMIAVPPAALLAALGLCSVARSLAGSLAGTTLFRGSALRSQIVSEGLFSLTLAGALVAAVVLNYQHFYDAMPQQQSPTLISMTIGGVTANPNRTAILAGDVSDNNLCAPFDGFGVVPARALHFQGPQLVPQCSGDLAAAPYVPGQVVVLVSQEDVSQAGQCAARLTPILTWPNKQRALYGFSFAVIPDPAATYTSRVAQYLLQTCPELTRLPPN